ncbi:MAG: S49 family peptidase [Pseudomonadota bacterium]
MTAENTGILTLLAQDYLKEKRSRRRWGIFFKILIALYLLALLVAYFSSGSKAVDLPHTALVEVSGPIGPQSTSADDINYSLKKAFEAPNSKAVVLRLNSPGGTPVQAAKIFEEVVRLRNQNDDKPIYAVITDVCASGCYYVAAAADEIYAHPSSLVGSIGVRLDGFGFVESMRKLGVERRLITAGKNKGMLDPFSPVDASVQSHTRQMLTEVHNQFIDAVKTGRGDRLSSDEDLFSGLVWSGEKAKTLGLVDGFRGLDSVARDVVDAEKIVDYTFKPEWWHKIGDQVGASIADSLISAFSENKPVLK